MCCREIQRYNWIRDMHKLRRRYILCGHRGNRGNRVHELYRRYVLCDRRGNRGKCVCGMSRQFIFASFKFGAYRLHLQRRFVWTKRGRVHALCGREIQGYTRNSDMHKLRRWYVLGRWLKCVCGMSEQFKFASLERGAYRVHLQRRL